MKNLHFVLFLFIFLVSCEKEDTPNIKIPDWLEPRIEELENWEHCYGCRLTRITFKNEYYYNVSCVFWSCGAYCELYDKNGRLVNEMDNFSFDDFITNKKDEVVLWSCPN